MNDVTFMIGASELAERMYETWRKRQDVVQPLIDTEPTKNPDYRMVSPNRVRRRPKWAALDPVQQDIWKDVAREIGGVLGDAIGARP